MYKVIQSSVLRTESAEERSMGSGVKVFAWVDCDADLRVESGLLRAIIPAWEQGYLKADLLCHNGRDAKCCAGGLGVSP